MTGTHHTCLLDTSDHHGCLIMFDMSFVWVVEFLGCYVLNKTKGLRSPTEIIGHPAYVTAQMMWILWMDVVDKFHGPEIPDHCPCCHPVPGNSMATWTSGRSFRAFRGRFLPHQWCWCLSWCRTIWINWFFWLLGDDWYTSYVYIGYIRSSWMFDYVWYEFCLCCWIFGVLRFE